MLTLRKLLIYILSIPKTVYFNFVCFPFKIAIRFPVLISYRVYIRNIHRGGIKIDGYPSFGYLKFGFYDGSFDMARFSRSFLNISNNGTIILKDRLVLPNGCIINVTENGNLVFGKNFICNTNLKISCENQIIFGDDVLVGWGCTFIDGDGHSILDENGLKTNHTKQITIGNHVWVAAESNIFKGTYISNNSVVSYGSMVSKQFNEENILIGGFPAKVLKTNINWKH